MVCMRMRVPSVNRRITFKIMNMTAPRKIDRSAGGPADEMRMSVVKSRFRLIFMHVRNACRRRRGNACIFMGMTDIERSNSGKRVRMRMNGSAIPRSNVQHMRVIAVLIIGFIEKTCDWDIHKHLLLTG